MSILNYCLYLRQKGEAMIFITGDTHGLINFDKLRIFAKENPSLTYDDYMIIAGDCGVLWSSETYEAFISEYTSLPFTVLFVDGNHENFDMLTSCPVEEWKGGKIHRVADNVIHLMRGQVFVIERKSIFTLSVLMRANSPLPSAINHIFPSVTEGSFANAVLRSIPSLR